MNEEHYTSYNSNNAGYPPRQTNYIQREDADRVGIGSWIFTIIIMGIPIVNIIYYVCLLLGFGLQPKVSLARAYFILSIISLLIAFIILCIIANNVEGVIELIKQFFQGLMDLLKAIKNL